MNIHIRYIGAASDRWERTKIPPSNITVSLDPKSIHLHDIISHPDFPGVLLRVEARHVDLSEQSLTLYLDLLPESQRPHLSLVDNSPAPNES